MDTSVSFGHFSAIRAAIADPTQGLPDPVFDFVRQVTPMINVDLLIRNPAGALLLSWRYDEYYVGWHVPGGIIRFREPAGKRIAAVARDELGAEVIAEKMPREVVQNCDGPRGHFISLLFQCKLLSQPTRPFAPANEPRPTAGALRWFDAMPPDIISVHRDYSHWFSKTGAP